jgi:hypothetical protein
MTTTIVSDGLTVYEQRDAEQIVHHCATRRVAQVLAAELELRLAGWTIVGLSSADHPRRPLLLPGEKMGWPLDGTRSDERAQGFTARRGEDTLVVDTCAGMPTLILAERGAATKARRIVEWHVGLLS